MGVIFQAVYTWAEPFMNAIEAGTSWLGGALTGLLAGSALLHFYYDGFIWKVRQAKTRDDLGLPSVPANRVGGATPSRDRHRASRARRGPQCAARGAREIAWCVTVTRRPQ